MASPKTALNPRKTPSQARSAFTVEMIFDATIQVLLDVGIGRLTTTRVADRAGVSVGTLYQYFPNKDSLLAAVLQRHLSAVAASVDAAGAHAKGRSVSEIVNAIAGAFFTSKFASPETSRALYALASGLGGDEMVSRISSRSQLALCDLFATACDYRFSQLSVVSYVVLTALIGSAQGLISTRAPHETVAQVQAHVVAMLTAYLEKVGKRFPPEERKIPRVRSQNG
jgi:AcrR family transcriptional regulator